MENIEKFRIIHNQYQFSKAFTLEYFKHGDLINTSSGEDRTKKGNDFLSFLKTYNFSQEQFQILNSKAVTMKLNVNIDNYDKFISEETIFDADFASTTYNDEKEKGLEQELLRNQQIQLKKQMNLSRIKIFSLLTIIVSIIFIFVVGARKIFNSNNVNENSTIKVDENSTTKEEENIIKNEKVMSFCDCLDLMKEMSSGGNITDEQAKLYQECLDNDVPTGNSAADQKERDRKMSECQ